MKLKMLYTDKSRSKASEGCLTVTSAENMFHINVGDTEAFIDMESRPSVDFIDAEIEVRAADTDIMIFMIHFSPSLSKENREQIGLIKCWAEDNHNMLFRALGSMVDNLMEEQNFMKLQAIVTWNFIEGPDKLQNLVTTDPMEIVRTINSLMIEFADKR